MMTFSSNDDGPDSNLSDKSSSSQIRNFNLKIRIVRTFSIGAKRYTKLLTRQTRSANSGQSALLDRMDRESISTTSATDEGRPELIGST
jgi:hypothetical protein